MLDIHKMEMQIPDYGRNRNIPENLCVEQAELYDYRFTRNIEVIQRNRHSGAVL